ncbi:MAG: hypothetical protein QM227_09450 [Bacillota bacterium]|jgi:uncharacterized protein (DUF302 family)|nr:hypothetical protein [Bacillota bacterium]NMB98345.1 hypothetical protein [Clostridiaceae bacterium]HHZ00719.1 hypothetical protein [Tissierellia bacterium]
MRKSIKILLVILAVILMAAGALVVWQYDNISALIKGLSSSSEDLAVKIDEHRNKVKTEIEKYVPKPIEDISAEDEKKLILGEISPEEVAEKYKLPLEYMKDDINNKIPDKKPAASVNESPKPSVNKPVDKNKLIEEEISNSLAQLYALKAKYVNKLGELEREVKEQYLNLPKSKQNKEGKKELVMANIDYVANLEKTCDSEVDKVVAELEKKLKELGGDLEIIQIIKDAYDEEKELKKSYYLSLYNE